MIYIKLNLLILILLVLESTSDGKDSKKKECENQDALKVNCYNEKTKPITESGRYRRHEKIMVKLEQIEGACSFQIPEYRLVILGPGSNDDAHLKNDSLEMALKGKKYTEHHFVIKPYQIRHYGKTILKFFPMSGPRTKVAHSVMCIFTVEYSDLKAVLLGGREKMYPPNQDTTIDASNSENPNEEVGKNKNLIFSWQCQVLEGEGSPFCTENYQFGAKSTVLIPANAAKKKYAYQLSVLIQMTIPNTELYQDMTSQIVRFSKLKTAILKIHCLKNCAPKSDRTLISTPVILNAHCENCEKFPSDVYYLWTIYDSDLSDIDYDNLRDPSQKGDTCYINPGGLEHNQEYTVKLELKGDKEGIDPVEFKLDTTLPPPLKDCSIKPTSGKAFDTGFKAQCTYFPGDNAFEIFSIKDGKVTLLAKTKKLETQEFFLPAGASVIINMTEAKSGYTQTATINVEVKETLKIDSLSHKEISNAVESKMDQVLELAKRSPALALQGLAAVVGAYSNMSSGKKDLELEMDHKAINTIMSINIDSPEQAKQAVDILAQITVKYQDNPDPELSLKCSTVCDKGRKILSAEAHKIDNPELMRIQMTNNLKSLASCSQAGLGQNLKSVENIPILDVVPTTKYPLMDNQKIPEQYDDYTDDVKASENMAMFKKASQRMKNICFSSAKMIVLTMVPEEDPVVNVQGSMSILSVRRYCKDIPNTHVGNDDVMLNPATDCKQSPVIDIMMCIVDKNPYWWKDNTPMITKVAYVKFLRSNYQPHIEHIKMDEDPPDGVDELYDLIDPFTITFKSSEDMSTQINKHRGILPNKSISEMDEDSFYEEVSTYRIYVFKNRGFTVAFENMTIDDYYDIVLTEFEKPSYTYFKNRNQMVSMENSIVTVDETRSYDTFWFLSVLPDRKRNDSNETNYFFSVTTMVCYTWNETVNEWVFACNASVGISEGTIKCYCRRDNIFTGHVLNNKVNLVENLILHFNIEVQRCWIIFITTFAIFALFCVALLVASFKKKDDVLDKVFFVGDVPSYFQYAYIIVIKTGKKRHSGTTSNIIMKLYGSASDSLEHVLNYPDPELIMLQRNVDTWFVIATKEMLGDVIKIEMWFDSVGHNTRWFGRKIEVYDIQRNISWNFQLENWFDVSIDEHNVFVLTPEENVTTYNSETATKGTIIKALNIIQGRAGEQINLWNFSTTDPLMMFKERVVIIFSILMMMLTVIMFLYNIPSFDESDSIDENTFGFNTKLMWTPILGATGVFLFHFPIVYFVKRAKFRNIKKKGYVRLFDNPEKVTYICWLVVTFSSTISTTVLICCGFWIPVDSSLLWLVSVTLGTFFNALVLQNISSFLYGYRLRLPAHVESFAKTTERIIQYIELQRAWLYKRFGSLSLRPYFQHLYYHLDYVALKERIKLEHLKGQMLQVLEDLIMIIIYVALLYVVLMLDKESMAVSNHNAVKNLVTGKLIGSKMDAVTITDIEEYLSQVLIPSIQSLQWYGKFVQDNPGMAKDFSNRYLGIIRIRQHRTIEEPCVVPKIMEFLNITCRPDYSEKSEFRDYSRQWESLSELTNMTAERMANSWRYSNSTITGSSMYFGELTIYPGEGYISTLGRTLTNSLINLKYLQNYTWFDLRTRAVMVEFLMYNPNINLFNTVEIVFEISAAGYITSNIKIQTTKLLMVNNDQIFTQKVINFCFVAILLVLSIRVIHKFVKGRLHFFYDIWSLFDIFIVILSMVSIYLHYARLGKIKIYVDDLSRAANNEFVNYFHLFKADNVLSSLSAMLVFISTFRLWKLLRFMIIIQTAEKTLSDASVPLLLCLFYQSIYIVAFSICGTLFFGADSKDFMDFRTTFTTLILLSINVFPDFNMDPIINHPLGIPYFTLYALLSLFFTTLYIAIITLYYADAKDFYSAETGFVATFLKQKWTYYTNLIKIRIEHLRGGEEIEPEEKVIKPRLGDRYENCMTIPKNRIQAMALVTMCVLWNEEDHRKMTEKDFDMISRMIKELFGEESSEKDIFFTTGDSRHIELVDNRKLEQIADICERLIVDRKNITRISRKAERPFFENRIERINTLIENISTITSILNNLQIRT